MNTQEESYLQRLAILDKIKAERTCQLDNGRSAAHDDEHTYGELAIAAACLCVDATDCVVVDKDSIRLDQWELANKHSKDRKKQLVIAGALIVAELERLERKGL
jgi:hypothetical protein